MKQHQKIERIFNRHFVVPLLKEAIQEGAISSLVRLIPMLEHLPKGERPDLKFVGFDEDWYDPRGSREVQQYVKSLLWAVPGFPAYLSASGQNLLRECAGDIRAYRYLGKRCVVECEDSKAWLYAANVCGIVPFERNTEEVTQ